MDDARALRVEVERMWQLVHSVPCPVLVLDASGRVAYRNDAHAALFGESPAQQEVERDGRRFVGSSVPVVVDGMQEGHVWTWQEVAAAETVDPMTQLLNRRGLDRASQDVDGAVVVFADLDGLKAINDGLGHETGDDAITTVAECLRRAVRRNDLVARLGGDEFAVICVGNRDGMQIVQRIRQEIAAADRHVDYPLSVSLGWTSLGPDDRLDEALRRADTSMYAQKRQRRTTRVLSAG